jgi:P22 coat protein - gene protein 5
MANTLTSLAPDIRVSLDKVSRELVGFIRAAAKDPRTALRAALNQTIRWPVAPAVATANNTAGQLPPNTGDQTIGNATMTISKSKHAAIRWNGEEELSLMEADNAAAANIRQQQFTQAFRALANEIETDLAVAAYQGASRAYGTAGTTPFASSTIELANVRKILEDNGAPLTDLQCVVDSAAAVKLRTLKILTAVNEAGSSATLRDGAIPRVHGFDINISGQIASHTAGTGTGYLVDGGDEAVGQTAITVDTGSGTNLIGDIVTFANDATLNKYVLAATGTTTLFTLAQPGLRVLADENDAITIGAAYTPNVCFDRDAVRLMTRLPAMPAGGDSAADQMTFVDPVSGLAFEVAMYREYLQVHIQVRIAWGVANAKAEHTAILIG